MDITPEYIPSSRRQNEKAHRETAEMRDSRDYPGSVAFEYVRDVLMPTHLPSIL